jgi:hypothetical protein
MRTLLIALLVLACTTPADVAAGLISVLGCDEEILERQLDTCPPRGPYPFQGCDQCLAVNHQPLFPIFQLFCGGPDRGCRLNPPACHVCNGACVHFYQLGYTNWFFVVGNPEPVRNVITNCNQWQYQSYCNGVTGAYFVGEDFSWIPSHGSDYRDLPFDPLYGQVRSSYTGPGPVGLADAWLYRFGVFAEMTRLAGSEPARQHYRRAALLSAWQYFVRAVPWDQLAQVLASAGFPDYLDSPQSLDSLDIHQATCFDFPFLDCTDPVEPSTWGGIKHLYRDP